MFEVGNRNRESNLQLLGVFETFSIFRLLRLLSFRGHLHSGPSRFRRKFHFSEMNQLKIVHTNLFRSESRHYFLEKIPTRNFKDFSSEYFHRNVLEKNF